MNILILNFICLFLGLAGIYVSYRIYKEKRSAQMVCPLNGQCQDVLFSKYAKVLGINLEYFGLLYYFLLSIGFLFLSVSLINSLLLKNILALMISGGFLFSLYLTVIQKFIIKKWCSWCLFSGLINLFLFSIWIFIFFFK